MLAAKALDPKLTVEAVAEKASLATNTIKSTLKEIYPKRFNLLPKSLKDLPVYQDDK